MARFCTLYSGSSGNSTYIGTGTGGILVDAGVSCKALLTALSARDIRPDTIRGLFLTHEHIDHIKGVRVLLKKYAIPLFASRETLEWLADRGELPSTGPVQEISASTVIAAGDMEIRPFATSHDSVGSLGYRISLPDGQELGFATDLGCYTEAVEEGLRGCRTVMLESNYDDGMILVSDYPYYLKRRIQSRSGHLSNSDCAAALPALAQNGTRNFVLGHLSQNNNLGLLAQQASEQALLQAGLERGDFTLQIANRSQLSQPVLL